MSEARKRLESERIAREVEEFLSSGNQIDEVPIRTAPKPKRKTRFRDAQMLSSREVGEQLDRLREIMDFAEEPDDVLTAKQLIKARTKNLTWSKNQIVILRQLIRKHFPNHAQ